MLEKTYTEQEIRKPRADMYNSFPPVLQKLVIDVANANVISVCSLTHTSVIH